jgi:hypothetical protein
MERLSSKAGYFVDKNENIIFLRGVNLSGSSKIPYIPDGTTHFDQRESFYDHRNVSFIGRPFPEEEAKEHFGRLKKWGFNFLRFLVTWEAIEHKDKGDYDFGYIDYVYRLVKLADKFGLYVFIDPHQDVWSRFTGGDGAPGWIFEKLGLDIHKFKSAESSIVHHFEKENYKKMIWPLNYQKYPTATMFTLFFGGNVFAPNTLVEGDTVQDYLQESFISAISILAKKLSRLKNVVGFDSLNEPSPGFIQKANIKEFSGFGNGRIYASSPFQEMCSSEGIATEIDIKYMFGNIGITTGKHIMNKNKISIWTKNNFCIWRKHLVWNYDPNGAPMLLKPDYFFKVNNRKVEFYNDFMKPFIMKYKKAIQKINKTYFIFIESDPLKLELNWDEVEKPGFSSVVNATHWYDGFLLFTKRFSNWFGLHSFQMKPVFGKEALQLMYNDCINSIKKMSLFKMNNSPTVIGEAGVPMDLDNSFALKNNDYSKIEIKLDSIFKAIEKNLVNITLWNYTPDNTHQYGDKWNQEDLSIYSKDTPNYISEDGGRGTKAFSRPYPSITSGTPISLSFDMNRSLFKYSFKSNSNQFPECKIYIPPVHYHKGFKVLINAGSYTFNDKDNILHFKGEVGVELYGITIIKSE